MNQHEADYDVIIAGGGPAGSSAAIYLAQRGIQVLLVEQKEFPRAKLCGEFISPECFDHFKKLGVASEMLACNPATLSETVFYSRRGNRVSVPSGWFATRAALGLSRAEMDNNLLRRAAKIGADVLENATVTDIIDTGDRICGVRIRTNDYERTYHAKMTIDATGRPRTLARKVQEQAGEKPPRDRARLVAFKAHFANSSVAPRTCEIYSYRRGYGGLSTIENGISNLCFIAAAKDVRRLHSDPELVLQNTLMKNRRAAQVLASARRSSEWLSVSLDSFGLQDPTPKPGLIAIGDSASFIDPFTGSGMLMALESGELAAKLIVNSGDNPFSTVRDSGWPTLTQLTDLANNYTLEYRKTFGPRLRTCHWLRRTAYNPRLADLTILLCSVSERFRNRVARATRSGTTEHQSLLESVK
ncbi:MAG TPA: NAD(P)/FAD-dependent oxidoreductase [Pyrinomonadaceae bacterium]|nr:NAD(P)/FAD-dependent oxidoreductase [Pyrinomonadaceae bacterium]